MANQIDTDAKTIGGADYSFGHPAIIRCSNTLWFAGHINQSDELEIHKCTDGVGTSWSLVKTLSNATGCFNLIAISSIKAGVVYQKNANEFEVWITINSGTDWTNKLDLTGQQSEDKAILLYDKNLGRIHIVYRKYADSKYYGKYSDNDGTDWTNWLDDYSCIQTHNYLDDGDIDLLDNSVYIIANYGAQSNNLILKFDSVGDYKTNTVCGSSGNLYYDKHLAIDSTGNRWYVYTKHRTSDNYEWLMIRENEGTEKSLWAGYADIIVKGSSSLSIDEDDNVYVYYTKASDEKTYYRKYNAGTSTWEIEVELIGVANNRINTEKHMLSGSDKLHFVYYQQP